MKHTNKFFAVLLMVCTVFQISVFAESPKREFRATWLAAVGVDWPDNKVSSGTTAQITAQQNELIAYLDQLVASNQNAVCYHVRPMADAFYQSNISLVPWSHYLTGTRGKSPGYDPLAFAIEEAHKRGLEIHAWLNPFRHLTSGLSSVSGVSSDPIKTQKPDWLLTYNNGSYSGTILDPGNPEVRAHIVAVVEDIITNYDVDGIIIDDYFYPYGGTTTEDATSKSKYKPSSQSDDDWRRENIDTTIKGIYDMIQSKEPWVRFGVSPFGIYSPYDAAHTKYGVTRPSGITGMDAYSVIYCNTLEWMDGGYVDYVSPQLYWAIDKSGQQYTTLSKWWSDMAKHFSDKRTDGKKIHFFSSQDVATHGTTEIGDQINYNRQYNQQDAPGSIFFSYDDLASKGFPSYLKQNKFTQLALPPAMDWKAATALSAPTNVKLSNTTLSWSHSTAERFTVYAYTKGSDNTTAMASSSNLVGVVYGKSLDVSGVSGYSSKTFAVCAYDRYGNEYNAGYYNLQTTTPTINANPTSFTLTGKHNQTSPDIDIQIEGLNLTSGMSVNSSTTYVSVEKLSDWNDLTGGTVRAKLSTSDVITKDGYIAVQSGDTKITIPFTITVQELVPTITSSVSSISLTGIQNSASKQYKDITITASDLSSDIAITSSDIVGYTLLSDWNARTGGTLRLTLNTSKTIGEYTGTVTVTSGTTSHAITINATITDGPQEGTVSISQVWSKANPTYIPSSGDKNRSIAYYDNKLYIPVYTDMQFHIVDAATGNLQSTKSLGVTATYHSFNLRMTDDGQLLSGNTALTNPITVFAVDKLNGGSVAHATNVSIDRSDYFDVYGSWSESGYVISYSNAGTVAYIPFKQGSLQTGSAQTLNIGGTGTSAKALACDETSFYAQNSSSIPKKYSITTGELLESFGSETPASGIGASGMATFMVANHKYMITPADKFGAFDIFEITEGLNTAKRVITTTSSLGSNANASVTVDFATHVDGNDAYIYVLAPNNGIAAYKFTFAPLLPTLTTSKTSVSLSGKINASSAPYVDVNVAGQNLTTAISIASTGSGFNVAKVSGWNDLTGGTLRITLNTALAADTYTGTITVSSGTHSQIIDVNATVNPLVPTITLGSSSVSLSAKQNATAPSTTITVTGEDLSNTLEVTTASEIISVEKVSGWNDLTGGKIKITMQTSAVADTYNETITVTSGSVSKHITVTATINPLVPTITLGSSKVSLSAKQNATAPSTTITIVGDELSSALEVTTASEIISVEKVSGWNDLTGGKIKITMQTSAVADTYTETITVTSGSVSKNITVEATIEPLQPAITVSESSIIFEVQQNAVVQPHTDVTINAEDLSVNLSVETSSDLVSVSKGTDWDDLIGGSLRITLNTNQDLGNHSCTITIKSGALEETITVNATITDVEPKLTTTTMAVSLWGEKNSTAPFQDVKITGVDLSEEITINSTVGNAVTITPQSDWNSLSGGTLRITLATSSVTTYAGTITISSGTASVEIPFEGKITNTKSSDSRYIVVSSPAISLTTTVGVDTYVDVVVTGKNLTSSNSGWWSWNSYSITTSDDMNIVTTETQSGWSNTTGGTLRIKIDASNVGEYTGTIGFKTRSSSRNNSAEIQVTVIVTDVNTEIQTSASSISLSGEQYATAPYQDVVVEASEARSDLTITTDAPVIVTPQADWNVLTGGTLRITLDTSNEVGDYSGSVTIASGSASAVIAVDASILAIAPKEGTITFDSNALWTQVPSTATTWLSTSGNNRSMAYYDGQLYISDRTYGAAAYHVVDAATGDFVQTLDLSTTDFCQHNLRITTDGQMLFGNTGSGSDKLTVRACSGSILSDLNTSIVIAGRSDYFYPYGNWDESGFLLALANTGALVKVPYANSSLGTATTLTAITLKQDPNDGKAPKSAKAIPASATAFYSTATYNIPVKYSINGSQILEEFGDERPAEVGASGLGLFSIHGHNYMITLTDSLGGFEIFDITDGLDSATRVIMPVPALGSTNNSAMTIDFCTHVSGNDVYIYQLVPNNGLRAYKFTFTPKSLATAVDEIVSNVVVRPTVEGVSLSFTGKQQVTIYSANGTLVRTGWATGYYACALADGVYIIRIGNQVRKFVK